MIYYRILLLLQHQRWNSFPQGNSTPASLSCGLRGSLALAREADVHTHTHTHTHTLTHTRTHTHTHAHTHTRSYFSAQWILLKLAVGSWRAPGPRPNQVEWGAVESHQLNHRSSISRSTGRHGWRGDYGAVDGCFLLTFCHFVLETILFYFFRRKLTFFQLHFGIFVLRNVVEIRGWWK